MATPSALLHEATRALGNLSLAKTNTLMFRLGVSRKPIHHIDARYSGDSVKKEVLVQKWLDSGSGASWDKLVSAIAEMMAWDTITRPSSCITVKVVVCGTHSAGKTEFIDKFAPERATIDFRVKTLSVGGKAVRMQILDTPNLRDFKRSAVSYLRQAQGIVLLYEVSNVASFDHLTEWIAIIEETKAVAAEVVIAENNQDGGDERRVPKERAEELARVNGFRFFEASYITGHNVFEYFASSRAVR